MSSLPESPVVWDEEEIESFEGVDGDDGDWYAIRTDPWPCPACQVEFEYVTGAHHVIVAPERDDLLQIAAACQKVKRNARIVQYDDNLPVHDAVPVAGARSSRARHEEGLTPRRMAAGYSGTPLVRKLGFAPGWRVAVLGAPRAARRSCSASSRTGCASSAGSPAGSTPHGSSSSTRRELERRAARVLPHLPPDGTLWISWPKRASGVPTDVTENVLREVVLPTGWVDIKVAAIDETWSGLRFALRRELRSREDVPGSIFGRCEFALRLLAVLIGVLPALVLRRAPSSAAEPPNPNDPCVSGGQRHLWHDRRRVLPASTATARAGSATTSGVVPGTSHTFCIDLRFWYPSKTDAYRELAIASDRAAQPRRPGRSRRGCQQEMAYAIWNAGQSNDLDRRRRSCCTSTRAWATRRRARSIRRRSGRPSTSLYGGDRARRRPLPRALPHRRVGARRAPSATMSRRRSACSRRPAQRCRTWR